MNAGYRYVSVIFMMVFMLCGAASAKADPFEVVSLRVEKAPQDCQSTLIVTIGNNSGHTLKATRIVDKRPMH